MPPGVQYDTSPLWNALAEALPALEKCEGIAPSFAWLSC